MLTERTPTPIVLDPPANIIRVNDMEGVDQLISFLNKNKEFGFDIETTPTKDFFWRRIRTMQFGNSQIQFVIDLKQFVSVGTLYKSAADVLFDCQGQYGATLWKAPQIQILLNKLQPYLCSYDFLKIGVNLAFEYQCLYWSFGMRTFGFYDCMLAEKCIWAGMPGRASLKNYEFYSMEEMMLRYFNVSIDKTLQTSFNLDEPISDEQYGYAALDTRTPIGLKAYQNYILTGQTPANLKAKGYHKIAQALEYLPPLLFGDNLTEIVKIECDAIGSFVDMHLHGERIDIKRWTDRVEKAQTAFDELLAKLDKIFVPIVGSKNDAIDEAEIAALEAEWKSYNEPTVEEAKIKIKISAQKRIIKKALENEKLWEELKVLETELEVLVEKRKAAKEPIKKKHSDLKKRRTKLNKLKDKCEGEALINYGSDAQLMHCLKDNFPVLSKLESMDDDTLESYSGIPVMKLIREYHGLSKEIGTYGMAWVSKWVTKPCKEEGWLHPGDGRLHCEFNQYDAETGRSSSSKPNAQNLPQDKEVRSSFIADPPDESVRISICCDSEVHGENFKTKDGYDEYDALVCNVCGKKCETKAEENVIITADMSGAELRIIADDSGDEQWISAFTRGEDLHSVGTELLYEAIWPTLTERSILKPDGWTLKDCKDEVIRTILDEDGKVKEIHPCAYFAKKENGEYEKKKCGCPGHNEYRNGTKACNFLLAYGGGPGTLAANIKKSFKEAKALMALHEKFNPGVWKYLEESGNKSKMLHKAFDLYGRRRLLPEPTYEDAKENCKEWNEKKLRLEEEHAEKNINVFIQVKGRKPTEQEEFDLTHREPTANEVSNSYYQMVNGIGRQGKNMRIQGTNATIIKIAMAKLWHILPQYKAKILKMVHDELVLQAPKRFANKVDQLVGQAFKEAAALKMKKVVMEFDSHIGPHWSK